MVKKTYQIKPHLEHLATWKKKTSEEREMERDLSRESVYPHWRKEIFQNRKATRAFFKEFDNWFFEWATDSAKERWWEGFNFVTTSINQKWINYDASGKMDSLTGFYSKMHKID